MSRGVRIAAIMVGFFAGIGIALAIFDGRPPWMRAVAAAVIAAALVGIAIALTRKRS